MSVARIEQREIRVLTMRLAPDFVSLNPGYACCEDVARELVTEWPRGQPLAASSRQFVEACVDEDELLRAENDVT